MQIIYYEGPENISMGIIGDFKKGIAREVNDAIGEILLKKETIKFEKVEDDAPSPEEQAGKKRRDK